MHRPGVFVSFAEDFISKECSHKQWERCIDGIYSCDKIFKIINHSFLRSIKFVAHKCSQNRTYFKTVKNQVYKQADERWGLIPKLAMSSSLPSCMSCTCECQDSGMSIRGVTLVKGINRRYLAFMYECMYVCHVCMYITRFCSHKQ